MFKGGIAISLLSLCAAGALVFFAFSAFPAAAESAAMRSLGLFGVFVFEGGVSVYVPLFTVLGAIFYSAISIILLYIYFEKTQSPEIFFIAIFCISLSFEIARIMVPLGEVFTFPAVYFTAASRFLLFGRCLGLFSLFAASVYAAGLDVQKQLIILLTIALAAIVIAANVPIDTLAWDSSLKMLNSYGEMFRMVEAAVFIIAITSFFISAFTRGSKSYSSIGVGVFLAFGGRSLAIYSDTWFTAIPGFFLLVIGTWLACSRLHKMYLWL